MEPDRQHFERDYSLREDGLPNIAQCRSLLHHLQCGQSSLSAAIAARLHLSPQLSTRLAVWRRKGLINMIKLEDLTDRELERLLYDTSKGRFTKPDYAVLHEQLKDNQPIYPQWLAYFRDTEGRAHSPRTFVEGYHAWLEEKE